VRVLGIDPGLSKKANSCALALVTMDSRDVSALALVALSVHPGEPRTESLARIREAIEGLEPEAIAVEDQCQVAVGAQARGQWGARNLGVILVQGLAHGIGVPVVEVQPQAAKARVTGSGFACKESVMAGVERLLIRSRLDIGRHLTPHEADAVAIAVAGFGMLRMQGARRRA
jgi:Holliday junction resolvasome RuvABC endonuclease subunit